MASATQIAWLKSELALRQEKNSAYSLRAFARDLGMSPSHLSHIFSGKRTLTGSILLKIAERLSLTPQQTQDLFAVKPSENFPKPNLKFVPLDADRFDIIGEWYYFAILSLADVKGSRLDASWLAKRLGIPESVAGEAIVKLLRLQIIERRGRGFKQIAPPIDSTHDVPSVAIRRQHRQILEKAEQSLANDPVDVREFGAVTLPVKAADLPKAKKMIRDFRGKFGAQIESEEADRVYVMSLQFFPLDRA